MTATLTATSPLDGLLVALDLAGIVLRRDGELLRAKPPNGVTLAAEMRRLIAEHKWALLEMLDGPAVEARVLLLRAYEGTLRELGREVQRLYRENGRQSPEALGMEAEFGRMLAGYERLCDLERSLG